MIQDKQTVTMGSELTQQKQKSLAELAPFWFSILTGQYNRPEANTKERNTMNLLKHDSCVVGEMHGFDGSYARADSENYCEECSNLSLIFARIIKLSTAERSRLIRTLEEHWNSKHAKKSR